MILEWNILDHPRPSNDSGNPFHIQRTQYENTFRSPLGPTI